MGLGLYRPYAVILAIGSEENSVAFYLKSETPQRKILWRMAEA